jgi:hypothetical protein
MLLKHLFFVSVDVAGPSSMAISNDSAGPVDKKEPLNDYFCFN